MNKAYIKPTI